MKSVCMRCEHGKGYFTNEGIIYVGRDGSVTVETKKGIIDFPVSTIKFCPWCGRKLIPTEKRKYYRKCGICGERHEQSEMIRTNNSPNGWICRDCYYNEHPEYEIDEW